MPALTEFLGKPIRDPNGEAVAALHDLVVRLPQTDAASKPNGHLSTSCWIGGAGQGATWLARHLHPPG